MSVSVISSMISGAAGGVDDILTEALKIPAFSVRQGGKVLTELSDRVISISLTDNRGFDADQLTLELDDTDGSVALPPRGAELSFWLGWMGEALVYKGIYTVDEVAHDGPPDRITVTARSADFREEFNVKREVSWHDVTVERVVSAIAKRYDLMPQISDMSFLTRMAEMLGAIATVKNGSLLFIVPGGGFTASGKAIPSIAITRSSGDRHRFRVADRDAYTGVRAYWLDLNYGKKKKVSVHRRATTKKKDKSSSREGDYIEGAEGNVFIMRKTFQNEEAARRAAAAKWQQLQRGAAEFSITLARGRAELYPEMHSTVTGFKADIDAQDWIISKVQHDVDSNGFTTQLNFEAKISDWIAETE